MSKIYFNQTDSRWANKMYSSVGNTSQTMKSSGCGPTSGAMIVSSLSSNIVYPDKMADDYVTNGYRSSDNGTYWSAFSWTAKNYGIDFKQTNDINVAIECINNGGMVVGSTSGGSTGLFSTNGHFIVLIEYINNTFTVYDSYLYSGKYDLSFRKGKARVSGNSVYVSKENTAPELQQYFCFYGDGKEITTKAKYVNVNTALNVRSGPGMEQSIVSTLSNNTMVTVYEEQNGWSKIAEGKWVYSQYLSDTKSGGNVNTVKVVNSKIGLNVRQSPSTSSNIVTAYKYGTRVTIYEEVNGWSRGIKGWMYSKYLS